MSETPSVKSRSTLDPALSTTLRCSRTPGAPASAAGAAAPGREADGPEAAGPEVAGAGAAVLPAAGVPGSAGADVPGVTLVPAAAPAPPRPSSHR
ncbi:hypothetical protein [Streptomyces sp. enrichment culture]|uniref:hypothetical protein n=1 Tax=Streptomyces sp. enrichment culture TaxID=1795815 RepID=UPI003F55320B